MSGEHTGHRERVKKRFLKEGIDGFEPHEVLEMLLFYAIPRRDTNVMAHRLLERFGSLSKVMDASIEELILVDGITENAATMLKMMPAVFRRYEQDRMAAYDCYDTLDKIAEFASRLFIGVPVEQIYLMIFNNRMEMIECTVMSDGTPNDTPISPRKIIQRVMVRDGTNIVLVHNHPNGTILPSEEDISFTHEFASVCQHIGVELIEHLVIADHDYCPILFRQKGRLRTSASDSFYRKFYSNYAAGLG